MPVLGYTPTQGEHHMRTRQQERILDLLRSLENVYRVVLQSAFPADIAQARDMERWLLNRLDEAVYKSWTA